MLNKEQFKVDIKNAYKEMENFTGNESDALDVFSERMASVFIKHIKTLEIVYSTGLFAPNGAVSGTINHTVK